MCCAVILVIFDVNLFHPWILLGLVLGTLGYVGVGTLFAALTASVRARESMLPILLLPGDGAGLRGRRGADRRVLDGRAFDDCRSAGCWMLAAYDLVFLTIAYLVFDLIWEEG